ncbi:hypothetical protein HYX11_04005 [Candidatus Woesearchaeota archaeon]|nr:hypothetical protein [Candidatus Woesearchaeota archaeon]
MAIPQSSTPAGSFDNAKLYMWTKSLETKVNNLLREVDTLKNDYVKKNNDLKKEVKSLNDDLLELKRNYEKTLQKMDMIIKELKQTAGSEELTVLRKYIDLWNPLNFVTQRDLEKTVEAKFVLKVKEIVSKNDKKIMIK